MATSNGHGLQIPVIDISRADEATGDKMVNAAARYGFLYIRANGTEFTPQIVDSTFELARGFFESPLEEKVEIAIRTNVRDSLSSLHDLLLEVAVGKYRLEFDALGDVGPGASKVPNAVSIELTGIWLQRGVFKEALNLGEFIDGKAQHKLPMSLAAHEAEMSRFADLCHRLCMKILELFALGLKIDTKDGVPIPAEDSDYDPEIDVRAGPHSDYGTITLLFQRRLQPGLEILTTGSTWSPVPVTPPGTENDPMPPSWSTSPISSPTGRTAY